jgi:hypothetical protein
MLPHIESLVAAFVAEGFPPGEALAAIMSLGNYVIGSSWRDDTGA